MCFYFQQSSSPSLNSAQLEPDEASPTHKGPHFFRGYKQRRAAFTRQRCAFSVQPALKTCVILVLKNEICLSLPGPCRMWNPALQCLNVWGLFSRRSMWSANIHFFLSQRERERGVVHYHSMSVQVEQRASHIPVPGVMTLRYADPPSAERCWDRRARLLLETRKRGSSVNSCSFSSQLL